jgi:hypothetical protein
LFLETLGPSRGIHLLIVVLVCANYFIPRSSATLGRFEAEELRSLPEALFTSISSRRFEGLFPWFRKWRVSSDIPAVRWVWAATQPQLRPINDSWRLDETYIRVNGNWAYLYRATQ